MEMLGIEMLIFRESVSPAGEEYVSSQSLRESRLKVDSPTRAGDVSDQKLRTPDLCKNRKIDVVVLKGLIHTHGQVARIL